jgi:membrane-associated phospholipid phosphatase
MRILLSLALAASLASAVPAVGQTPDSTQLAREPLFTRRDALYAGAFVAGALALAPVDRELARSIQGDPQTNDLLRGTATGFRILGHPGSIGISGALYLVGRAADRPSVADLGLHTGEAILFGQVFTVVGKTLAGRARPSRDPENTTNFSLGRGWGDDDYQSFPSGHTSAAFAAAAAATGEIGRWWPRYRVPAGIALYTGATLVGVSRMYNNKHWASDVIVGAAVGTFSGWKTVSYTHAHPRNPIDRILLRTAVVPVGPDQLLVVWTSAP